MVREAGDGYIVIRFYRQGLLSSSVQASPINAGDEFRNIGFERLANGAS